MRRCRRPWVSGLSFMTAALVSLLVGDHLSAQTPAPTPPLSSPPLSSTHRETDPYEQAPTLFSGPNGDVLRVSYRANREAGSGAVIVATPSSGSALRTLVEIDPREAGITAGTPDLAVGPAGELRVAYQWWRKDPTTKQIRLALSDDGGKTWTQPTTAVDSSNKGFQPKIGWGRAKNLAVVWSDERRPAPGRRVWDIYARHSPDGGQTWEPEQLLSRFPQHAITDAYFRPELLSDNQNRFWVVWVGIRSGRSRLFLSRSTDGGRTWADPLELSGQSQSVFGQRLVGSGDRLLVVWMDKRTGHDRIFAVTSTDGGLTWTSPSRVDHLPTELVTDAVLPAVVMTPEGEALVAWHDGRNGRDDIFVTRSVDGGRTWEGEDLRLDMDEAGTGVSRFASLARAKDGKIAVAWEDDRAGYEGVYLRVRGTGAKPQWGPEILVEPAGPKKAARTPVVLWGKDGSVYLTWEVWNYAAGPMSISKRLDGRAMVVDKK